MGVGWASSYGDDDLLFVAGGRDGVRHGVRAKTHQRRVVPVLLEVLAELSRTNARQERVRGR